VQYYTETFNPINKNNKFETWLNDILEKLNQELKSTNHKDVEDFLYVLASLIKRDFHKEEKEWRYFILSKKQNNNNRMKLLTDEGVETRYVFDFSKLDINKIIKSIKLGPHISNHDNKDRVKEEIKDYLKVIIKGCITGSSGRIQ
jgi:hypothetical protein